MFFALTSLFGLVYFVFISVFMRYNFLLPVLDCKYETLTGFKPMCLRVSCVVLSVRTFKN